MKRVMNQAPTRPSVRNNRRTSVLLGLVAAGSLITAAVLSGTTVAYAAEAKVNLGTVESFSVIAGDTVTNTGPTTVGGDLGVFPGSAVTGFPPGLVLGALHATDAVANQAQNDLTTAYNDAAGRSSTASVPADLAGQTLTSGVYTSATSMGLSGALTLDAQGDPNAVFIFQAGSTLTTGSASSVTLTNGASPCNVFWQVGSSATLGTNTQFVGTVMALTSATLNTGATVNGRILARNGAVTLDTNVLTTPSCAPVAATSPPAVAVPASPTPTTSTPTTSSTSSPTGAPTTSSTSTGSPATTPPVPVGHPATGLGGADERGEGSATLLFILAGLATAGAVAAPLLRNRLAHRG